jgi:ELWxxDGT repeat protein
MAAMAHHTQRRRRVRDASPGDRGRALRVEALEDRRMLALDFDLLADINPTPSGLGSKPRDYVQVGSYSFFTAGTETQGRALWKTDGTEAGTVLVKQFYSGPDSESTASLEEMTNVNGTLYFVAYQNGRQLWKSDGTAEGTVTIDWINPGNDISPSGLTSVNGVLYFSADDGVHGRELWRTDGTAAGTRLVKDIYAGAPDGMPASLVNVQGTLYFWAQSSFERSELWRSDGTAAGTVRVRDLGSVNSVGIITNATAVGDRLFFTLGFDAGMLWVSDGTPGGTQVLRDQGFTNHFDLTEVNGVLYFVSTAHFARQPELWRSNGTASGTTRVDSMSGASFANVDGTVYFAKGGDETSTSSELWKVDGSTSSPVLVKHFETGSGYRFPTHFVGVGGTLFFRLVDEAHGDELWKSDGTMAGTTIVQDIRPGVEGSATEQTRDLGVLNGELLFSADDGVHGVELWKTSPAANGAVMLKDIRHATWGSGPARLTEVGGYLYFVANDGVHGYELWKTDGTPGGTAMVKDIATGAADSAPEMLTNVNGTLFFAATDAAHGRELWKSDGTAAGTTLVRNINPSGSGLGYYGVVKRAEAVGDQLYFTADDGVTGLELWRSDGTEEGTVLVKDILPGAGGSFPGFLESVDGRLYFAANDGVHGYELWTSDGGPGGTALVKDILVGSGAIENLTNVNGTLYFSSWTQYGGTRLWKLAPGALAPEIVKTFASDNRVVAPYYLTNVQGVLYLVADDGASGAEIWKSDGTEAGTVVITDVSTPNIGRVFSSLHAVGNTLYFSPFYSNELWVIEGSTVSTVPVSTGHVEASMYAFNRLYVVASSEAEGKELFSSPLVRGFPSQGDFDEDRDSDGADFLTWQRNLGFRNRVIDGDDSGTIGAGDLAIWTHRFGSVAILPGDFDADDDADGADFLAWQRTLGLIATPAGSGADGDASGIVDQGDLQAWQSAFGGSFGVTAQAAAVQGLSDSLNESVAGAEWNETSARRVAVDELFAAGDFTSLFDFSLERGSQARRGARDLGAYRYYR